VVDIDIDIDIDTIWIDRRKCVRNISSDL